MIDEKVLLDHIQIKIQEELQESNLIFFGYAWRDKIENILMKESRFSRLVEWINNELEHHMRIIRLFNPSMRADYDDKMIYTVEMFENYKTALLNQSLLIHAREIILDKHCTENHREAIEAMLCKMYNIKYYETRNCYVSINNN